MKQSIQFLVCLFAFPLSCIASDLELLVPAEIGAVAFGDPVYIPFAIANNSQQDATIGDLDRYQYQATVSLEASGESYHTSFANFEFSRQTLKARHVESGVMGLNVWHPFFGHHFTEGSNLRICIVVVGGDERLTRFVNCKINGTAFKSSERFFAITDKINNQKENNEYTPCIGGRCQNLLLENGLSSLSVFGPLGWGVVSAGNNEAERRKRITDVVKLLDDRSAPSRAFRCCQLRAELLQTGFDSNEANISKDAVAVFLPKYKAALENCTPAERQFQIRALSQLMGGGGLETARELRNRIREEFVDVLGNLDPTSAGGMTTSSELTSRR